MLLFESIETDESLYDFTERFDYLFNENTEDLEKDEHGFIKGSFKITVEYIPE